MTRTGPCGRTSPIPIPSNRSSPAPSDGSPQQRLSPIAQGRLSPLEHLARNEGDDEGSLSLPTFSITGASPGARSRASSSTSLPDGEVAALPLPPLLTPALTPPTAIAHLRTEFGLGVI